MLMRTRERGFALILVLVLLAMGALLITPSLRLADTTLKAKRTYSDVLQEQYARDGCAEFAVWALFYGTAAGAEETRATCPLNGIAVDLVIKMRTTLGNTGVAGAEENRVRVTKTVVCDDGDVDVLYDDDCSYMVTGDPMSARYTVTLEQVSPDLSVGIVAVYEELGTGVTCKFPNCAATSPDLSFTEITLVTPTDIRTGGDEIWKWAFFSSPVFFSAQGEKKRFEFEVDLPGGGSSKRHCNQVFLKMQTAPHEKSGMTAVILVGASPPDGCVGGGMTVEKFVDTLVAPPGQMTKFTYIINVQNMDGNTLQVKSVKDVLPQGTSWGSEFKLCSNPPLVGQPPGLTCDAPMYKVVNAPFPPGGNFSDTTGYSPLNLPAETQRADIRWEEFWDFTGTSGSCALPGGCSASGQGLAAAGGSGDVLTIRFQAYVTPEASGSYYNEVFVDANCSAPTPLTTPPDDVTTSTEYCATYSWPTGGTLVPMYDVRSDAGGTSGQGNVAIGASDASLESWHIGDQ